MVIAGLFQALREASGSQPSSVRGQIDQARREPRTNSPADARSFANVSSMANGPLSGSS